MSAVCSYKKTPNEQENLTCTVKWFNLQKGYGFLEPPDGDTDIFMHFSVLEEMGYTHVFQGDEVVCSVAQGRNGVQVTQIHEIKGKPAAGSPKMSLKLEEKTGTVKWFNILRGYGFVEADDQGRDIFIHTGVLKRINVDRLPRGQRVRLKVLLTERGREAREVFLEEQELMSHVAEVG